MSHTRILYRQFLFRLMDVEFLAASARGDASQLFSQFAALLIYVSLMSCYAALIFGAESRPREITWLVERLLGEGTMLVVGIFALLNWDSTFPDRRDVQVLAPLPVRASAIWLAKIAAAASSLGLTVLALHCLSGLAWPFALAPAHSDAVTHLRFFAAFWIAMAAAGTFLYCSILGVQGLIALLPRGWFLRLSSFLQVGAFGLFIGIVFLQPSFLTEESLAAPANQRALAWLPAYWFMGLFNEISGAYPADALAHLASRAIASLGIAAGIALLAFLLSWLRGMRKIAEEPDILPGSRGGIWLPPFGSRPHTALVQFTLRTLVRSCQHRMNLAFYLGFGFAMMAVTREPLVSTALMLCLAVVGTRVAYSRPMDLRANWLFRVLPVMGGSTAQTGARRGIFVIAVAPVWIAAAAWVLCHRSLTDAAKHLPILALFGILLGETAMMQFRKIPFTCSYLPGKSKVNMVFPVVILPLPLALMALMEAEQWASSSWLTWLLALTLLVAAIVTARKYSHPLEEIQFEEFPSDELIGLNLS